MSVHDSPTEFLQFVSNDTLCKSLQQCSFKTIIAYIHQKRIREMFDMITCKQTECEDDAEIYGNYLRWGKRLSFILKMLTYTLTSNFIFFSLYLLLGIAMKNRKFIFILNIPGLDPNPNAPFPNYEVQLTFQLVALYIGVFEVIGLDGLFAYFTMNAASIGESIIVTIERLSMKVDKERITNDETAKELKRIIHIHRNYLDFINLMDQIYNGMFLMQFGSFAFSGSLALYVGRIVSLKNAKGEKF